MLKRFKFLFIALLIYPIVGGGGLDAPLYTEFCEFCVFLRAKPEESLRHRRNMQPQAQYAAKGRKILRDPQEDMVILPRKITGTGDPSPTRGYNPPTASDLHYLRGGSGRRPQRLLLEEKAEVRCIHCN